MLLLGDFFLVRGDVVVSPLRRVIFLFLPLVISRKKIFPVARGGTMEHPVAFHKHSL